MDKEPEPLTVKQLIEELMKMPMDVPVWHRGGCCSDRAYCVKFVDVIIFDDGTSTAPYVTIEGER